MLASRAELRGDIVLVRALSVLIYSNGSDPKSASARIEDQRDESARPTARTADAEFWPISVLVEAPIIAPINACGMEAG